ncbi:hypothetical protein G6514_000764 [Epicoccum nigrum]|nr:hypothetical protein G6514_000764 [Epicoccum nigrum]
MAPQDTTTTAAATEPPAASPNPTPVVCVFCGASSGTSPAHLASARALARALHASGTSLVYGGGTVGLMGEVARTLVSLSGPDAVHGIIPAPLVRHEQSHIDPLVYGRTTVVKDMHARKQLMAREVIAGGPGGGFVALGGGYGTFEELMEVTTWNQLGIHSMPVVVYNVEGYWTGLMEWIRNAVSSGFVGDGNKGIIKEARSAEEVMTCLREYEVAEGRFGLSWEDN